MKLTSTNERRVPRAVKSDATEQPVLRGVLLTPGFILTQAPQVNQSRPTRPLATGFKQPRNRRPRDGHYRHTEPTQYPPNQKAH
jgi:hypothetical protein